MNVPALILLAVFTIGTRLAWRRGARLIALGCLAAAGLFAVSVWRTTHPAIAGRVKYKTRMMKEKLDSNSLAAAIGEMR